MSQLIQIDQALRAQQAEFGADLTRTSLFGVLIHPDPADMTNEQFDQEIGFMQDAIILDEVAALWMARLYVELARRFPMLQEEEE